MNVQPYNVYCIKPFFLFLPLPTCSDGVEPFSLVIKDVWSSECGFLEAAPLIESSSEEKSASPRFSVCAFLVAAVLSRLSKEGSPDFLAFLAGLSSESLVVSAVALEGPGSEVNDSLGPRGRRGRVALGGREGSDLTPLLLVFGDDDALLRTWLD